MADSRRQIEFYCDPVSPYVWLASTQIDRIKQQTGLEVVVKPVLFAGLLKANNHKGPAEIESKRLYTFTDVLRRASRYQLDVTGPPCHPFNPLLALRAIVAIDDAPGRLRFTRKLLAACWQYGEDLTSEQVVARLANDCDMNGDWLLQRTQAPEIKQELIDVTQAAFHSGVFGVPTFRLAGQLFWGDDRIDELLLCAGGKTDDTEKLHQLLAKSTKIR